MVRAWTLISISEGRQYGGNLGYEENPTKTYRYDSSVPNHLQVGPGDLVFVRDRNSVLGMARIAAINAGQGIKTRLRCPECGSPQIKERKKSTPRWRCVDGHLFAKPDEQKVLVDTFQASYGGSFIDLKNVISVADLKKAALRPSDQLSIEELDVTVLADQITSAGTAAGDLLGHYLQARRTDTSGYDASKDDGEGLPEKTFTPGIADMRERINRSIALRKGQRTFRNRLIRRYGPSCMISDCKLLDIVEAAHIWPYRGEEDNHPDNGLLLRTDLHTLFDLDLLGIDPEKMNVKMHPLAQSAGYAEFENARLRVSGSPRPSAEALGSRWSSFQERLNQRAATPRNTKT